MTAYHARWLARLHASVADHEPILLDRLLDFDYRWAGSYRAFHPLSFS